MRGGRISEATRLRSFSVSSFCLLFILLCVGASDFEGILNSRSRSDRSVPDSASSACVQTRRRRSEPQARGVLSQPNYPPTLPTHKCTLGT
jgi:hypothetical protein